MAPIITIFFSWKYEKRNAHDTYRPVLQFRQRSDTSYSSNWITLLLLYISAPLVLCCDRFDRGSRQVKRDLVDMVTEDYYIALRWRIITMHDILGDSPTQMAKMRTKMRKVWRKIMMEIWGKMRKVERLPTRDCEAGYTMFINHATKIIFCPIVFVSLHKSTLRFLKLLQSSTWFLQTRVDVAMMRRTSKTDPIVPAIRSPSTCKQSRHFI